jgi:hypothetical protein
MLIAIPIAMTPATTVKGQLIPAIADKLARERLLHLVAPGELATKAAEAAPRLKVVSVPMELKLSPATPNLARRDIGK